MVAMIFLMADHGLISEHVGKPGLIYAAERLGALLPSSAVNIYVHGSHKSIVYEVEGTIQQLLHSNETVLTM